MGVKVYVREELARARRGLKLFLDRALLVGIVVFLFGCAKKSDYQVLKELSDLELKFCEPLQRDYVCAVGAGRTPGEAERNAKEELAGRILSVVFVKFDKRIRQVVNYAHSDVNTELRQVKEFIATNFTYLESEGVEVLKNYRISNGESYYYVAVGMRKDKAAEFHKVFARKVDAFVYINLLENTKNLSLKISFLKELVDLARTKNLFDEKVVVGDSITTVYGFISAEKEVIRSRLKTVYTGERVYLIDSFSLSPVQFLELLFKDAKGKEYRAVSSEEGSVELHAMAEPVHLYVKIGDDWELIASLERKLNSKVYIYTEPKGLYYELSQNGRVVSSGPTPNVFSLTVQERTSYELSIFGDKVYSSVKRKVYVNPGYDTYIFEKFERVDTEEVSIEVEGDAVLTLESSTGRLLAEREKSFKGNLAEGRYLVTVRHEKDSDRFQLIKDSFFLRKGKPIRRRYFEPMDRHFFREGWGAYIASSQFTSIPKGANFNVENAPKDRSKWDISVFSVGGRRYFTYVYVGANIGLASLEAKGSNSSSSGGGGYVDMVSGLYNSFWNGIGAWEFGVGYAIGKAMYNEEYTTSKAEASFALPFLSFRVFAGLGFEIKVFPDSTVVMSIQLGGMGVRSGYKYPREVKAKAGKHYEDF